MSVDNIDLKLQGGIIISFLLLVFFLPLLMWTRASEVFELPKMVFVYVMTAVIAGLWLGRMALRREILIRRTPLDIPILLFLISQMASTIYSIDPQVSWWGWYGRFHGGLVSTISYTLLYYAFVSNCSNQPSLPVIGSLFSVFGSKFIGYQSIGHKPTNRKLMDQNPITDNGKLITVILASAAIISGYAILQHFGIDKNFWVQDVVNRVFSTQGQPNWLAGYLVMIMPLGWILIMSNEQITENNEQKGKKFRKVFIAHCFLLIVFFLALLWTKSRSGLVGLAAADLTFWLVSLAKIRKKEKGRRKKVGQFVYIHVIAIFLMLITNNPAREALLKNGIATLPSVARNDEGLRKSEYGGTESGDIRRIVWTGALQLVKQRPVFGFGPETFGESYWRVRPKEHNLTSEWNFLYNKAHNEWLNLAANTGLFGLGSHLLLLLWFSVWNIKRSLLGVRQGDSSINTAILAAIVGVEAVNFFGFSTVTVGVYRYLFMGFSVVILKKNLSDRALKTLISDDEKSFEINTNSTVLKKKMRDRVFYTLISNVNLWQYLGLATIVAGVALTVSGMIFRFLADLEYNRGRAYAEKGYAVEAMEPLMRAVNWVPEEPVFRAELAETEAALAALMSSETYKGPAPPRRGRALSETAMDLKNDSLINFEIVRKQSPYNLGFLRNQARAMFLLGNCAVAPAVRSLSSEASGLAPESVATAGFGRSSDFSLKEKSGSSEDDENLCGQALQLMKAAMEMAPTNPQLPYSLGTMLTKMGQGNEAAVYYNKAVELKPDYPEALKEL